MPNYIKKVEIMIASDWTARQSIVQAVLKVLLLAQSKSHYRATGNKKANRNGNM